MKKVLKYLIRFLERFVAIADLGLRFWVAWVFYKAGLTKVIVMGSAGLSQFLPALPVKLGSSTLLLFTHEYKVPLLSPEIAAYLGSYTELILPVFLIIGLGGRWAAGALFVFNIIAVISYPGLNGAAIAQHQLWGLILLYLLLRGPGKLSIDHIIRKKHMPDDLPHP